MPPSARIGGHPVTALDWFCGVLLVLAVSSFPIYLMWRF